MASTPAVDHAVAVVLPNQIDGIKTTPTLACFFQKPWKRKNKSVLDKNQHSISFTQFMTKNNNKEVSNHVNYYQIINLCAGS